MEIHPLFSRWSNLSLNPQLSGRGSTCGSRAFVDCFSFQFVTFSNRREGLFVGTGSFSDVMSRTRGEQSTSRTVICGVRNKI